MPIDGGNWIHELKLDGYRIQTHLRNGTGRFYSRNGHDWSNAFPHLLKAISKLGVINAILDGEVIAQDRDGRSHFQLLQNSLKSKSDKELSYYVFDILYLDGQDLRNEPLIERKKILKGLLKKNLKGIVYSDHIHEGEEDFFKLVCSRNLEGIVSKLEDSPYKSGRNDFWTKTKCLKRQEFVIGGWTDPKGGRSGIGALLLGVFEGEKLRYTGKVGTGFNTKSLAAIKEDLASIEDKFSPFEINSPVGKNLHWVSPVKACEISFSGWTEEGLLRNSVFLGMREDKLAKDIYMETPAKNNISSPDKIIFHKERITKLEVLNFYKKISRSMLPYLSNRPLSLVRCPNGSDGDCFFQKHISGKAPESFKLFPIKESSGESIYLSIDSAKGLGDLVQLNAFELHAWNCLYDDYSHPDQIVMDLDPGPLVQWKEVVNCAFELKQMLEDLNLVSFAKLTGGKGIHLHIPVSPVYTWDQIKSFSEALAKELVARSPSKYVANMSKKIRKNKIFVDYLRNSFGATAVAPYSLRAKPVSAVALPLEWSELRRSRSSQQYTLKKALKKINSRKRDPWQGMLTLKQKILVLEEYKEGYAA